MVNVSGNRAIPHDVGTLRMISRQRIRRLITRINNKTISVRKAAKTAGISHPTLLDLIKNPDKELSRKTMIRILQGTSKKTIQKNKRNTVSKMIPMDEASKQQEVTLEKIEEVFEEYKNKKPFLKYVFLGYDVFNEFQKSIYPYPFDHKKVVDPFSTIDLRKTGLLKGDEGLMMFSDGSMIHFKFTSNRIIIPIFPYKKK